MAIYGKELCKRKLAIWLDAEERVAAGQRYQIGDRSLTRADLGEIREQMEYWAARLKEAEAEEKHGGRNRVFRAVPRDV